jgi:hypothetical protein
MAQNVSVNYREFFNAALRCNKKKFYLPNLLEWCQMHYGQMLEQFYAPLVTVREGIYMYCRVPCVCPFV